MRSTRNRIYIGVCGRAQHGKSTLVKQLEAYFNGSGRLPRTTAFAMQPKLMLLAMGLTREQLFGSEKEIPTPLLGNLTPRYAMQTLATEWGRKMLYDGVWVDSWQRNVDQDEMSDVILIEDVRHATEIKRLRELGAIIVEVYRPAKMPQTPWGWLKHWVKTRFYHSSERLDFAELGIPRIVAREGCAQGVLDDFLAMHPALR
jgi:hypothetical protein